ncbi:HNH endonuclease [Actinomyces procaprae]|uniref:HNH endonuclease n=1 Tax=Actinomyces procaprae TaxID=2560010 RepID=UPI0010A2678E|nr:HNH endonuclease signature motif containing protein [Actinomyces procaprae]
MPWSTSNRRQRLPRNWPQIRAQVLARAHGQCQAINHAPGCDGHATDIDHITPGDNHTLNNLQALSAACHLAKTARETAARNHARARLRQHPDEKHPGEI